MTIALSGQKANPLISSDEDKGGKRSLLQLSREITFLNEELTNRVQAKFGKEVTSSLTASLIASLPKVSLTPNDFKSLIPKKLNGERVVRGSHKWSNLVIDDAKVYYIVMRILVIYPVTDIKKSKISDADEQILCLKTYSDNHYHPSFMSYSKDKIPVLNNLSSDVTLELFKDLLVGKQIYHPHSDDRIPKGTVVRMAKM